MLSQAYGRGKVQPRRLGGAASARFASLEGLQRDDSRHKQPTRKRTSPDVRPIDIQTTVSQAERRPKDHFLATQAPRLETVPAGQVFTVVLDGDIALKDSQQAPRMR
ncbi:MAG TPA: hypothetical protein VIU82_15590 [Bosea sp. (in: a-proteobacteria)]